jgi:hypothetical protein
MRTRCWVLYPLFLLSVIGVSVAGAQTRRATLAIVPGADGSLAILSHASEPLPVRTFVARGGDVVTIRARWSNGSHCSEPYGINHHSTTESITVVLLYRGGNCITFDEPDATYQVAILGLRPLPYRVRVYLVEAAAMWNRAVWGRPLLDTTLSVTHPREPE